MQKDFTIIPAVDILDGKCVRLEKGDFSKVTVYSDEPVKMAQKWQDKGYKWLHVVDLDGAKTGTQKNLLIVKEIAKKISIPIEVSGGLRSLDRIKELFDCGVSRVILGTVAFENLSLIKTICDAYGDKVAIGIDARKDIVLKKGWLEKTSLKAIDIARRLVDIGVKRFVYTDISRDGMMSGPNYSAIKKFASSVTVPVTASGGVTTDQDIEKLAKIKNVDSCIVGRAVYEGRVTLV
ncbi:MAG: 1-(5-phosphoribosyl)-5-[(5-phosphoribosylamino)methylideneamino]imidazole-4-carboxamide isomerase [Candidatus Margulisiibacteriota bacterium]